MVTGVHFVEAYGLNPAIYSAHLKLHPLLVLSVLVFAEHSLGVWGLLLAVPLTVFTLDYCIRYPACSVTGERVGQGFLGSGHGEGGVVETAECLAHVWHPMPRGAMTSTDTTAQHLHMPTSPYPQMSPRGSWTG